MYRPSPNNNINTNIVCDVTFSVWIRCKWWGPLQMTSLIYVQVTLHWYLSCISISSVFFYSVLMNAGIILRNRSGRFVCRNLFTVPCHVSIQSDTESLQMYSQIMCQLYFTNYNLWTQYHEYFRWWSWKFRDSNSYDNITWIFYIV